jgi:hypothetical protein
MEVTLSKCDKCFEEVLPAEFNFAHEPKPAGHFEYPDARWEGDTQGTPKYVRNLEHIKWASGRRVVWASLPEKMCVVGDDDYQITICLDHLGLQLKSEDDGNKMTKKYVYFPNSCHGCEHVSRTDHCMLLFHACFNDPDCRKQIHKRRKSFLATYTVRRKDCPLVFEDTPEGSVSDETILF